MKSNKRFAISFAISICVHIFLIFGIFFLIKNLKDQSKNNVAKVKILKLKKGTSQDITKNTDGSIPISDLAKNSLSIPKKTISKNIETNKILEKSKKVDNSKNESEKFLPSNLNFDNLVFENQINNNPQYKNSLQNNKIYNEISDLYGEKFGDFGTEEKDYITNNLRNIGRITQSYLTYPKLAIYFEQSGINVVEFNLHPNGDISDLKIITSSGLNSLDNQSLETIKIAYKDYPYPKVTTLIRVRVNYAFIR
ncbi:MAG: TonB family protein [Helicobacter sp.]|nr:TonB family protein [Helicobacter sp.]